MSGNIEIEVLKVLQTKIELIGTYIGQSTIRTHSADYAATVLARITKYYSVLHLHQHDTISKVFTAAMNDVYGEVVKVYPRVVESWFKAFKMSSTKVKDEIHMTSDEWNDNYERMILANSRFSDYELYNKIDKFKSKFMSENGMSWHSLPPTRVCAYHHLYCGGMDGVLLLLTDPDSARLLLEQKQQNLRGGTLKNPKTKSDVTVGDIAGDMEF